jgi:drug/metabolite transporter (DMT)-like permease
MRICFALVGGFIGGIFPGCLVAFWVAAATGMLGEVVWPLANVGLGIGGAFLGMVVARTALNLERQPFRRFDYVLFIGTGIVFGLCGYCWLYWGLSHANPPL